MNGNSRGREAALRAIRRMPWFMSPKERDVYKARIREEARTGAIIPAGERAYAEWSRWAKG